MTIQDELASWDHQPYDAPRVTEEKRYVRVLGAIGSTVAFIAYVSTLLWAGAADGNEGALNSTGSSSAQTCLLVWCAVALAALIVITMAVAVVRKIARCFGGVSP